jgi:hypothetical protein
MATQLLLEDLSIPECAHLNQMMNTPGFPVLVKLFDAAIASASAKALGTNPEDPNHERLVAARAARARAFQEIVTWVRDCSAVHVKRVVMSVQAEDLRVAEAVGRTLGIHPAKPTDDVNAITKTFGIHPAKPVKKETVKADK